MLQLAVLFGLVNDSRDAVHASLAYPRNEAQFEHVIAARLGPDRAAREVLSLLHALEAQEKTGSRSPVSGSAS